MNIVILDAQTLANTPLEPLERCGDLKIYDNTEKQDIVARCLDADVVISNKVVLDADALSQLPKLKLICVAATGTNNISLDAAKALNIAVTNVAGYSTPSVVQHTFTLLGNLMGNVHQYIQDCHHGLWQKSDMFCRLDHPISEIAGKKFTIIGYGALGQAVAKVAEAFGAQVIIAEQRDSPTIRAGRVPFEQAIQQADIISIHCPLTNQTRNLFDEREFATLKPSCVLINTARGGIVNEAALVKALSHNQLAGAAVDVLSQEPAQSDNPLLMYHARNLILTPHIAWASKESIARLVQNIADNIQSFNCGEQLNRVI
ncbi:D-2-hydroxyacid dehydrogenase [Pseudoalteromonas sp. MMG022]|uniref:D-2-hydroxyacid dehydrogenase n=1 Tax=Pseudoalteromonas sp. MMG022 TaxID=2909978 RepID=UPI001F23C1F2|nr:D-2-hydroxyacid dehydrogenase [Pseudoalteromonas sp. MMG022]MCF6436832.1 D-2-hydroxyacid dehydrogenase [Pseudoalteromonas sp. MMG022]